MTQFLEMTGYSSNKNNKKNKGADYYSIDEYDIENQLDRKQNYKTPNSYSFENQLDRKQKIKMSNKIDRIDKPFGITQRVENNTINEDNGGNLVWREIDGKKYPPLRKTPTDTKYKEQDELAMMHANLEDGPIAFGGKKTRKKQKRAKKTHKKSSKKRNKKSYKKRGKK